MKYWWVNQNKTYKQEVPGGFLWSPKKKTNGHKNQFYDNMKITQPGDIVFSFSDTKIKAIGSVKAKAETASKPDFGKAGAEWSRDGWLVPVEFIELDNQIKPKNYIDEIRPHLPDIYSPLQKANGDGLQSVYLAEVPESMALILIKLIGNDYSVKLNKLSNSIIEDEFENDTHESHIHARSDIGKPTKKQLINARRGQGIFKNNVKLIEPGCRITGVNDSSYLIASHIKPWKDSNDQEKLDGNNGLLLSPHIDKLFDSGMISFHHSGEIIVSELLNKNILCAWNIPENINIGSFNKDQLSYLSYHHEHIFKT